MATRTDRDAPRGRGFGVAVLALGAASCASVPSWTPAAGAPLVPVVMPRGGEADRPAVVTDGVVAADGWYCSAVRLPQHFELMFADGLPRTVRAVGLVPGNLGPDGVGPVEVRVQTGHGVAAVGTTFRAEVRGAGERLHVVVLPAAVTGDHVVLTLLHRSEYNTAACLAEILVYETVTPALRGAAVVTQAEPSRESPSPFAVPAPPP